MKNKIAIFLLIFFCNFLLMESAISKNYKTGTVIEDEFYITKNFRLPLSEGKWVVVRKEHFIFSGVLQEIVGIAKVENNELLELIEVYRGLLAGFYESTINNAINAIVFKDPYDGCYQRSEYYLLELYKKGNSHNCLIVRHYETNKELKYPDDPKKRGVASKYNYWIRQNSIKIPNITFASEHSYFSRLSRGDWIRVIYVANPKIYNAPLSKFGTEESSEYHPHNINIYPEHEKIMKKWVSIASKRHKYFEKIKKIKKSHELKLDKYILKHVADENVSVDLVNQIKKLNDLFKSGALTKKEFEKAKKKLLD